MKIPNPKTTEPTLGEVAYWSIPKRSTGKPTSKSITANKSANACDSAIKIINLYINYVFFCMKLRRFKLFL